MRTVNDDPAVNHAVLWWDPEEHKDEPAFVFVRADGTVGMATLDYIVEAAYGWIHEGYEPDWIDLKIKIPGANAILETCIMPKPQPVDPRDRMTILFFLDGGRVYEVTR